MTQKLRADARENRDRILAAAHTLLSRRGVDVGMREVAREAGVGPATLYRHFPTRHQLVAEVFAEEVRVCEAIVRDGATDADPARGFITAMSRLIILNAQHRGFVDAFMATAAPGHVDDVFRRHRQKLLGSLWQTAQRAQASGNLRSDLSPRDIEVTLFASRGLAALNTEARGSAERFAQLMCHAFSDTERSR